MFQSEYLDIPFSNKIILSDWLRIPQTELNINIQLYFYEDYGCVVQRWDLLKIKELWKSRQLDIPYKSLKRVQLDDKTSLICHIGVQFS